MQLLGKLRNSQPRVFSDTVEQPLYSLIYSLNQPERYQESVADFFDIEACLRVDFQLFADTDEAAAVFLDIFRQIKGFGDQLVAQVRLVGVGLEVCYGEPPRRVCPD